MICPECKKNVKPAHFSCHAGAKGGAAGKGKKASPRKRAAAIKANRARWK